MRSLVSLGVLLAILGFAAAQDEQSATGKIVVAKHLFKLQAGDVYETIAEGKNFQPELIIKSPHVTMSRPALKFTPAEHFVQRLFLMTKESGEYPLYVNYGSFGTDPEKPLDYKITLKRIAFAKKTLFEKNGALADTDPPYKNQSSIGKNPFKAYPITLKAGKFYRIDMVRKKTAAFGGMDPYLYLEDPTGKNDYEKVVARDDDSGGDLNARIVYQATKNGEFRIIASSLNKTPGEFTVTVHEQE